jgi:phosphoglycolate phosphatase-like HAD superfamily hydrolase
LSSDLLNRTATPPPDVKASRMPVPLPRPPAAILFDFDGVIVDSARLKTEAYATIYAGEDPAKVSRAMRHQQMHGGITRRATIALFEREFFGRSGDPESVEKLALRYGDIVFDPVVACAFIPGAQTLLNRALGRVDMYLISGTPHEELLEILRARGLGRYFKRVYGAPTGKPEAFRKILESGRYKAEQTLAVGDSMTECDAAAGLGIPFLGIAAPDTEQFFPDGVVTRPSLLDTDRLLGLT